jgi:hypothetical protein
MDQQQSRFDLGKVIADGKAVLAAPQAFYRTMPHDGGFAEPLIYIVVMAAIAGLLMAVLALFGLGGFADMGGAGFAALVTMPIGAVIGSFIAAAVLFIIWKLMGAEFGYETAYRCGAYAAAIYPVNALLSVLPYIGSLVGIAWLCWLMVEASVAVFGRERGASIVAFGILGILLGVSSLSSEYASRQVAENMRSIESTFEGFEDLPPEEAGRRIGEFLKGMEEGMGERPAE